MHKMNVRSGSQFSLYKYVDGMWMTYDCFCVNEMRVFMHAMSLFISLYLVHPC